MAAPKNAWRPTGIKPTRVKDLYSQKSVTLVLRRGELRKYGDTPAAGDWIGPCGKENAACNKFCTGCGTPKLERNSWNGDQLFRRGQSTAAARVPRRSYMAIRLVDADIHEVSTEGHLQVTQRWTKGEKDMFVGFKHHRDAHEWREALIAMKEEDDKNLAEMFEVLKRGSTLFKYNYSNSKRARRHFWLSNDLQSLIWGKSRDDYSGEVDLRDVIGIVYGPLTTTFKDAKREAAKRNDVMPDKPWNCFSLLQAERTVDLACIGDAQTEFWFMGLQRCIFEYRTDMTVASWPQFIIKRCQMKMKLNLYGGMGKFKTAIMEHHPWRPDATSPATPVRDQEAIDGPAGSPKFSPGMSSFGFSSGYGDNSAQLRQLQQERDDLFVEVRMMKMKQANGSVIGLGAASAELQQQQQLDDQRRRVALIVTQAELRKVKEDLESEKRRTKELQEQLDKANLKIRQIKGSGRSVIVSPRKERAIQRALGRTPASAAPEVAQESQSEAAVAARRPLGACAACDDGCEL
jgi:hypothetical protein